MREDFEFTIIRLMNNLDLLFYLTSWKIINLLSPSKTASKSDHVYICIFIIISNSIVAKNMITF